MSKEITTLELNHAVVEVASDEIVPLDNLNLALIGGGEATTSL